MLTWSDSWVESGHAKTTFGTCTNNQQSTPRAGLNVIIHPLHRMCQSNSHCMNMCLCGQKCKYIHSNQPIRFIPAKYLGGPPWRGPLMLTHVDEGPWESSVPPSHTDNQDTCQSKTHDHESYVVLLCVKLKYCQLSAKIQFHTKHVNKAIILYQYGLGTPALATKLEKCM